MMKNILSVILVFMLGAETCYAAPSNDDEFCANQYLLKQYDVAFAACNKLSKTKPSYISLLNVGNMYLNGLSVKRDASLAMRYFQKASQHQGGDGTAEHNLAYAHSEGIGVKKNSRKAIEFYKNAASSGHEGSQFNLAMSYFNGEGVSASYSEGYAWLLVASKYESNDANELLPQIKNQIPISDQLLGTKRAREIMGTLPISRKQRMREVKEDLIKILSD